ncbi:MAG: toll/interleukin-1 receptor domain-containing protein [Fibrobacterota bacterium]
MRQNENKWEEIKSQLGNYDLLDRYINANGLKFYILKAKTIGLEEGKYFPKYYLHFILLPKIYFDERKALDWYFAITEQAATMSKMESYLDKYIDEYGKAYCYRKADEFKKYEDVDSEIIENQKNRKSSDLVVDINNFNSYKPEMIGGQLVSIGNHDKKARNEDRVKYELLKISKQNINHDQYTPEYLAEIIFCGNELLDAMSFQLSEDEYIQQNTTWITSKGRIYFDELGKNSKVAKTPSPKHDIFIVHADEDKAFTEAISKQLQKIFNIPDNRIFAASDSRSIPSGKQWYGHIVEAHKSSKTGIVLLTPNSIDRLWVNFEVGGFVLRDAHPPISICCSRETEEKIAFPISGLQYRKFFEKDDRNAIIGEIAALLGCPKPTFDDTELENTLGLIRHSLKSSHEIEILLNSPQPVPPFYTQVMNSNFIFLSVRINNKTDTRLSVEYIYLSTEESGGSIRFYHMPFKEPAYLDGGSIKPLKPFVDEILPRNNIQFYTRFQSPLTNNLGNEHEERFYCLALIMSDGTEYRSNQVKIPFLYYERTPGVGERHKINTPDGSRLYHGCPAYDSASDRIIYDSTKIGKNHDVDGLLDDFNRRNNQKKVLADMGIRGPQVR